MLKEKYFRRQLESTEKIFKIELYIYHRMIGMYGITLLSSLT
jgi:hypothetical protein